MITTEEIKELVTEITNCTIEEIKDDTSLKDELGMDSLDAMELVMMVEEKTGMSIPEEKLPEFATVSDIADYINSGAN